MGENPTSQQQEVDCRFGRLNERGVPDNEFEYFCIVRKRGIDECPGHECGCPAAQLLLEYEEERHNLDEGLVVINESASNLKRHYLGLCEGISS